MNKGDLKSIDELLYDYSHENHLFQNSNDAPPPKYLTTTIKINGIDYIVNTDYLEKCEEEGKDCAIITKDNEVKLITKKEFAKMKRMKAQFNKRKR